MTYRHPWKNELLCGLRFCEIHDCNKKHYAKGFCKVHYLKNYRGTLNKPTRRYSFQPDICSVKGCSLKSRALTYCNLHYRRFKKYGDPLICYRINDRRCKIKSCFHKTDAYGLCSHHRWMISKGCEYEIKLEKSK